MEDRAFVAAYHAELRAKLQKQRDALYACLVQIAPFKVYKPSGAYFMLVDISRVADPGFSDEDRSATSHNTFDYVFCRWLARVVGVGCVPATPFFTDEHRALGEDMIRFAFPKTEATMALAIERLSRLRTLLRARQA